MKSIQHILLMGSLLFGVSLGAQSQTLTPDPAPVESAVYVVTYIEISAMSVPQAIGLLLPYRDAGRAESGNSSIDLHQEVGRPYHFAIYEQWQDRAAFDAHQQGPAATQLLVGLKDIQSAPPESRVFQGFAVGPVRPPGPGRAQVYSISQIEVPVARLAEFRALVTPLVETSRTDGGGMRFDVLQELNPRQNQLTVLESWSNPQAYEAHRTSAHVQRFREGLAPMLIGLYDDRLYGIFD